MARGWESKSVEDQVEQAHIQHDAAQSTSNLKAAIARAAQTRERQALELQRDRILDERTSSPIRRAALEAALSEIEAKLSKI